MQSENEQNGVGANHGQRLSVISSGWSDLLWTNEDKGVTEKRSTPEVKVESSTDSKRPDESVFQSFDISAAPEKLGLFQDLPLPQVTLDRPSHPESKEAVQSIFREHCKAVRRVLSEHVDLSVDAIVEQTMRLHVASLKWGTDDVSALRQAAAGAGASVRQESEETTEERSLPSIARVLSDRPMAKLLSDRPKVAKVNSLEPTGIVCPGGCGYQATSHSSGYCCGRCLHGSGHGLRCKMVPIAKQDIGPNSWTKLRQSKAAGRANQAFLTAVRDPQRFTAAASNGASPKKPLLKPAHPKPLRQSVARDAGIAIPFVHGVFEAQVEKAKTIKKPAESKFTSAGSKLRGAMVATQGVVRAKALVGGNDLVMKDMPMDLDSPDAHHASSIETNLGLSDHFDEDALQQMQSEPAPAIGIFADSDNMKQMLRECLAEPDHQLTDFYSKKGVCQRIARQQAFEFFTLIVIGINSLWMSIDVDYNTATSLLDADPVFVLADNFFCLYFVTEWSIRFGAFKFKRDGLKDFWFVFDSFMCAMIVMDTWVFTAMVSSGLFGSAFIGDATVFKGFRLVRLVRMSRMIRVLKAVPELMVVITGMQAAFRAVTATVVLMLVIVYVFAIFLRQITFDTDLGNLLFPNVPDTMRYLLLSGTLPDQMDYANEIWDVGGIFYAFIYLIFALVITITVMNMLVGVLVGVVQTVSEVEKEGLMVKFVKRTILQTLNKLNADQDHDGMLTRTEFVQLLREPIAWRSFHQMGVDVVGLCDIADYIFQDDRELPIQAFMELLMELRGNNVATVKDIVDMRKFFHLEMNRMQDELEDILEEIHQFEKGMNLLDEDSSDPDRPARQISYKTGSRPVAGPLDDLMLNLQTAVDWSVKTSDVGAKSMDPKKFKNPGNSELSSRSFDPKSFRNQKAPGPLDGLLANLNTNVNLTGDPEKSMNAESNRKDAKKTGTPGSWRDKSGTQGSVASSGKKRMSKKKSGVTFSNAALQIDNCDTAVDEDKS